jgi:hypothetical protein
MARPVADYLVHFGLSGGAKAPNEGQLGAAGGMPADEAPSQDPAVDLQTARDEAFEQGFAAARVEYETRLAQEKLAYEARLTSARESWTQQEGERLDAKIEAAFVEVESAIAGSVARILQPFVIESVRGKMIDLLSEQIGVLLRGRDRPLIEIRGPEDLLSKLRGTLPAHAGTIGYFPSDSVDLQILADETLIETQIGAWGARICSLEK